MQLIDTNILIYSGEPLYSQLLLPYVTDPSNIVSAVNMVETLGFPRITPGQILYFKSLFTILRVIPVDDLVIQKAIELRQQKSISLGDSFIAATALLLNASLVTRNTSDFSGIVGLNVINPIP